MEFEKSFRLTIRALREQAGISQESLAADSELDRTYISLLERGKRVPSLTTIVKVSKGLGMPLSEIIKIAEERLAEE